MSDVTKQRQDVIFFNHLGGVAHRKAGIVGIIHPPQLYAASVDSAAVVDHLEAGPRARG
jgi:hypothetical protein